jgi:hypothetical protein
MRDLVSKVDRILLHDWDPIGVCEHLDAWDEYSSYAPFVLRIAMRGNVESVFDYLHRLKHEHMGLSHVDIAHDRSIAIKIFDVASLACQ